MINRLLGAATLFTAGAIFIAGAPQLSAAPLLSPGGDAAQTQAGQCGAKDLKSGEAKDPKAPAKAKAKDGSCGKGSCGSKDLKKHPKKVAKDGTCGKTKQEASCGANKK